jgi:hypothetical protein
MTVIRFPGHNWARCTDRECVGCVFCNGGLASCTVCGGGEGTLPTDCPGERMTATQQDAVYAGSLDYTRKEGWTGHGQKTG